MTLLQLAVWPAIAANWYVDNAATGLNNGMSWTNAWTSFSSIVWGGSGVKAGDTLFISGGTSGQTYPGGLTVGASGTSDPNRITIMVGQDASHGGVVTINGTLTSRQNYVTINGGYNGQRHIVLASGYNLDMYSAVNPIVYYLDISGCDTAIAQTYGTGGEIAYCYLHSVTGVGAIDSTARNLGVNNWDLTLIHNNTIQVNQTYGSGVAPDGIHQCQGFTIYSNYIYSAIGTNLLEEHQDLIQTYGSEYIKIYDNTFANGADSTIGCGSSPYHIHIWNNVFYYTFQAGTCVMRWYGANDYGDILIDNNTFVDVALQTLYGAAIQFTGSTATNVQIRNNIFYNCGHSYQVIQITGITNGIGIDYNLLNAGAHGNTSILYSGFGGQVHGQTGVPVFVSYSEGSTNNNFHRQSSDTAAKDKGETLTYFSNDKDGVPRPQGPAWDIGAYEFGTLSNKPAIATFAGTLDFGTMLTGTSSNLTLMVTNMGGGTLTGTASVSGPFQIVSGGSYNLGSQSNQPVIVQFKPTVAGRTNQAIAFTSNGGNTNVNVTGWGVSALLAWDVWQVAPLTVQTKGSASGTNNFSFNFGDGNSINGASATNTYATQGTYKVTITVTNAFGQVKTDSKSIIVTQ